MQFSLCFTTIIDVRVYFFRHAYTRVAALAARPARLPRPAHSARSALAARLARLVAMLPYCQGCLFANAISRIHVVMPSMLSVLWAKATLLPRLHYCQGYIKDVRCYAFNVFGFMVRGYLIAKASIFFQFLGHIFDFAFSFLKSFEKI